MSDHQHNNFTELPDKIGECEFPFGTFVVGTRAMNEFEVARRIFSCRNSGWCHGGASRTQT